MTQQTLDFLWSKVTRKESPRKVYAKLDRSHTNWARYEVYRRFTQDFHQRDVSLVGFCRDDGASSLHIDLVLDTSEEFVIAHQKSALRVLSVGKLADRQDECDEEVVIRAQVIQRRESMRETFSCGFSTVQFVASSLNIICGYHRIPLVDVFDLECVDEAVCDPVISFNFTEGNSQPLYANDVCSMTNRCSIAGLSNGSTSFLDFRARKPVTCTGSSVQSYVMGQKRKEESGICTVRVLDRGSGTQMASSYKDGRLKMWDLRNTSSPLFDEQLKHEVCQIVFVPSPTNGCPLMWLNSTTGYVGEYGVGPTSLALVAELTVPDVTRNDATASASPKLQYCEEHRIVLVPNVSMNTLHALVDQNPWWDERPIEYEEPQMKKLSKIGFLTLSEKLNSEVSCCTWLGKEDRILVGACDGSLSTVCI